MLTNNRHNCNTDIQSVLSRYASSATSRYLLLVRSYHHAKGLDVASRCLHLLYIPCQLCKSSHDHCSSCSSQQRPITFDKKLQLFLPDSIFKPPMATDFVFFILLIYNKLTMIIIARFLGRRRANKYEFINLSFHSFYKTVPGLTK
jgi:hypothetical protein